MRFVFNRFDETPSGKPMGKRKKAWVIILRFSPDFLLKTIFWLALHFDRHNWIKVLSNSIVYYLTPSSYAEDSRYVFETRRESNDSLQKVSFISHKIFFKISRQQTSFLVKRNNWIQVAFRLCKNRVILRLFIV